MSLQFQGLGHESHDKGLRDGLAAADGQGIIAIGPGLHGIFDKQMPGHGAHGI